MRERVLLDDDFQMSAGGESSSNRKFVILILPLHLYKTFASVFIGEVLLDMAKEEDRFNLLAKAEGNSLTPLAGLE
jgi:hypothetical protein